MLYLQKTRPIRLTKILGLQKNNLMTNLFVSERNPRSLHAHQNKLGMKSADEFEFNGEKYSTLMFGLTIREDENQKNEDTGIPTQPLNGSKEIHLILKKEHTVRMLNDEPIKATERVF